ncbi:unnamed protein product [Brassicogethes aeneus]|uniref:ARF7 effector protein C-terminal domain-containing protein n=1 Tax=Brassicogethes aeneus TaxID=1431903 RepID=A0A9P0BDJ0_BRAAE|nr:unnamed protein product [Brassicogethes aeneus]
MSTSSSTTSDDDLDSAPVSLHRVAKKSTSATAAPSQNVYSTRRQMRSKTVADRFLENFNPETSVREKRKLIRKINPPSSVRRPMGAVYDEHGVHVASGMDLCDCLNEDCVGCGFECTKCGSQKCGTDCRVHRKFIIDQVEFHGYDHILKNPLQKY